MDIFIGTGTDMDMGRCMKMMSMDTDMGTDRLMDMMGLDKGMDMDMGIAVGMDMDVDMYMGVDMHLDIAWKCKTSVKPQMRVGKRRVGYTWVIHHALTLRATVFKVSTLNR